MRLSIIKLWISRMFGRTDELDYILESLQAENDPYEQAKRQLEEELHELEEESEKIDKKLSVAMFRLKKVDAMYKKVVNGEALNDLESGQLHLIRL